MNLEELRRKAVHLAVAAFAVQLLLSLIVAAVGAGTELMSGATPALLVSVLGSAFACAVVAARVERAHLLATGAAVGTLVLIWIAIALFGPDDAGARGEMLSPRGERFGGGSRGGPGGPSATPFVGFLFVGLIFAWLGREAFARPLDWPSLPAAALEGLSAFVKERAGARAQAVGSLAFMLLGVVVLSVFLGGAGRDVSWGYGVVLWAFRAAVLGGLVGFVTALRIPDDD